MENALSPCYCVWQFIIWYVSMWCIILCYVRRSTGMWRWWSTARWPESGHLSAEPFEQLWLLEWHCEWWHCAWCHKGAAWALRLAAQPWRPDPTRRFQEAILQLLQKFHSSQAWRGGIALGATKGQPGHCTWWHCAWCQTFALVKALAPQVKVLGAKPWQNKSVQDKGCTERLCRCLCMLCCHSLCMFLFYMFLLLQREKQLRISVLRKHKKSTR